VLSDESQRFVVLSRKAKELAFAVAVGVALAVLWPDRNVTQRANESKKQKQMQTQGPSPLASPSAQDDK
jgi:hypothetical protein